MALFTWKTGTSADWNVAADWTGTNPPPGAFSDNTDIAIFGVGSAAYNVTIAAAESYNTATVRLAGSAADVTTLKIDGSLTTSTVKYSGGDADSANIVIGANGVLDIAGTEAIAITGTTPETIIIVTSASGTGGHLMLGSLADYNTNVAIQFTISAPNGANDGEVEYQNYPYGATVAGNGAVIVAQNFENVLPGSSFVFDGANFDGDTYSVSGTTLNVFQGTTEVMSLTGMRAGAGFSLTGHVTFNGDAIDVVCYAAGTRIMTATGERMIETLMPGDIVLTLTDDGVDTRPVTWVGRRRIDIAAHPRPHTVAPVRICRGAFSDGIPHTDLLVSPDHAILVDGMLIAARQLINGATIRQDSGRTSVVYYHVELDRHGILLAEGLPAESYLDTGNRGFFANGGAPLALHPDLTGNTDDALREALSCVPFVWDPARVRPIWQRLAARAAMLGPALPRRETTADPGLRIVVKGRTIAPMYAENGLYIFVLPRGVAGVRLLSRAGSPTDASPWLEDRRTLGVYVERMVLRGSNDVRDIPLDHPGLSDGWWGVEQDGVNLRRWTDGSAVVPVPAFQGPVMLEIRASSGGLLYAADREDSRRAA
jgi:hypothetical protein